MNYIPEIAKMLGVEIGEEFRLSNSEYIYKIVDNGLLRKNKPIETWYYDNSMLRSLLSGEIEIIKLPKPILDEKEKEYLSNLIKPYRNRVKYICKYTCEYGDYEVVSAVMKDNIYCDYSNFLTFKKGSMYKNMKLNKGYALWELGL